MPTGTSTPVLSVLADLQSIFGARLDAFVVYSPANRPTPSVAIVQSLDLADLTACAERSARWQRAGAATPVVLTRREFARSLDAFPVEFGEIIDTHETLFGADPFAGLSVAPADLRRACEGQTRSLLLHLREDYMEAAGDVRAIEKLVIDSAPEFRSLVAPAGPPRRAPPHRPRPGGVGRRAAGARSPHGVRRAARGQRPRRQQRRCGAPLPGLSRRGRAPRQARGRVVIGV